MPHSDGYDDATSALVGDLFYGLQIGGVGREPGGDQIIPAVDSWLAVRHLHAHVQQEARTRAHNAAVASMARLLPPL